MGPTPTDRQSYDAVLPAEMAARAEDVGVRKARLDAVMANMYFIPEALAIRAFAPAGFWSSIDRGPADYPNLTVEGFIANVVPVTIGNVIGGAVTVGIVYWFIYLRGRRTADVGRTGGV